jgi:hypothetical protein
MAAPRLIACLALVLGGGCVQFERGPTTDTSDDETPETSRTGEQEDPPPTVTCDPLAQDCPDGQACTLSGGGFTCFEVLVEGGDGDACLAAAECSAGLACVQMFALASCDASSCCSAYCDVNDAGAACADPAEVCGPVFTGDDVPPMWADYGVCQLP